jgi:hypothetical protein
MLTREHPAAMTETARVPSMRLPNRDRRQGEIPLRKSGYWPEAEACANQ